MKKYKEFYSQNFTTQLFEIYLNLLKLFVTLTWAYVKMVNQSNNLECKTYPEKRLKNICISVNVQ